MIFTEKNILLIRESQSDNHTKLETKKRRNVSYSGASIASHHARITVKPSSSNLAPRARL